ncbi:MAG: prepilin-type N-terminal cleavage/methylation domain-containing protein [Nitrospinae bacterium]|nr:prepilin-type N-terminal cleavage/methylation domain-containing protein [Nitrospinota bacterium]
MKKQTSLGNFRNISGFTLIEVIMVIVIIGILASVAAQKFMTATDEAEITAEDATIENMRSNLINNIGNDLLQGVAGEFPNNPFNNLRKVPSGYNRRASTKPTGAEATDSTWVFVQGANVGNVTAEQAGTTLTNFSVSGFIYRQRKDGTVVRWPYDQANGVIGKKFIEKTSPLKQEQDQEKLKRGEAVEKQRQLKTQ